MSRSKLVQQFAEIKENLKNIKNDWKERLESLKKCQSILNSEASDEPYFAQEFETLAIVIGEQFSDLRSGIVKEASNLIRDASELLGESISRFGEKILSGEKLLKQINSGNKIVSELAHEFIKKTLSDANPKARDFARTSLTIYMERFPGKAKSLVSGLGSQVKRQLSLVDQNQALVSKSPIFSSKKTPPPPKKSKKKEAAGPRYDEDSEEEDQDSYSEENQTRGGVGSAKNGGRGVSRAKRNITSKIRGKSTKKRPDSNKSISESTRGTNQASRKQSASKQKLGRQSSNKGDTPGTRGTSRAKRIPSSKQFTSNKKPPSSKNLSSSKGRPSRTRKATVDHKAGRKGSNSKFQGVGFQDELSVLESIEEAMIVLDSKDWKIRVESLKKISSSLSEGGPLQISGSLLKKIFAKTIQFFEDIHIKVQVAALNLMNENWDCFVSHSMKKKTQIFSKIILCMAETKEFIKDIGRELLKKFTKENTEREVMELIIKVIHTFPNVRAQLKALELMNQILIVIQDEDYFGSLVRSLINKITFIFKEKNKDKEFTSLCMQILTKSFSLNPEQSNEYFTLLSPSLQNYVIQYAEKHDQDFLDAFESGVSTHHDNGFESIGEDEVDDDDVEEEQDENDKEMEDEYEDDFEDEADLGEESIEDEVETSNRRGRGQYGRVQKGQPIKSQLSKNNAKRASGQAYKQRPAKRGNKGGRTAGRYRQEDDFYDDQQEQEDFEDEGSQFDEEYEEEDYHIGGKKPPKNNYDTFGIRDGSQIEEATTKMSRGSGKAFKPLEETLPKQKKGSKNHTPQNSNQNAKGSSSRAKGGQPTNSKSPAFSKKKRTQDSFKNPKKSSKESNMSGQRGGGDTSTTTEKKRTRKIDLNVDLIDPQDEENVAKTLELLNKKLSQLKQQSKMSELKNLLHMAFPYMVRILSFEIEFVHTYCFDLIQSTYAYFNLCNEAYCLLLSSLLELFDTHQNEIDLLHEVADLIIMYPFRAELMKQLLTKFESPVKGTLQILMKLMVSLLAAANCAEINATEFRKGFNPYLGRLVYYLTNHINNQNPEVRKGVVFILVELHFFLSAEDFVNLMDNFNSSHKKLVSIYIKKKQSKQ